jgi:MYXO-CTERM domain-containing protein
VPAGCTSDAQCAATERCNTSTGACEPRPMVGRELGEECGAASECRSGLCFGGRCSQSCDWLVPTSCPSGFYCSGEATGSCTAAGVCVPGSPGSGALGDPCTAATDCASAYCASGRCTQPCIPGGAAGCPEGYACQVGSAPGCGSCQRSGTLGDPCEMDVDCTSRLCATIGDESFCTQVCEGMGSCPEGFECESAGAGISVCVPISGTLGTPCSANENCLSGLCATEGSDRSYCTRLCDSSQPCPEGFACIVTSDPSVRVCRPASSHGCGCAAPGTGSRSASRAWVFSLLLVGWIARVRRKITRGGRS